MVSGAETGVGGGGAGAAVAGERGFISGSESDRSSSSHESATTFLDFFLGIDLDGSLVSGERLPVEAEALSLDILC